MMTINNLQGTFTAPCWTYWPWITSLRESESIFCTFSLRRSWLKHSYSDDMPENIIENKIKKIEMRTKKSRMPDYALTLAGFGPRPPDVGPQRQHRKATCGADVAFGHPKNWELRHPERRLPLHMAKCDALPRTPSPCGNEGSADIHRSFVYIQYTHIIIAPSGTGPFASWLSQRIVDFRSFWTRLGPLRGAAVTTWRILTLERPMSHLSLQMLWCKFWRFLEL